MKKTPAIFDKLAGLLPEAQSLTECSQILTQRLYAEGLVYRVLSQTTPAPSLFSTSFPTVLCHNIFSSLTPKDLCSAARVNRVWRDETCKLLHWRQHTAPLGLISDDVIDHKILARLHSQASWFFNEEIYNRSHAENAQLYVFNVKLISFLYKCNYRDVIQLYADVQQIITQGSPGALTEHWEILLFNDLLILLKLLDIDVSFETAANFVKNVYRCARTFICGLMMQCVCENESAFEQIKLLTQHCGNDFDIAFQLICIAIAGNNSAWEEDNPRLDFINNLNRLIEGISDQASEGFRFIQEGIAAIKLDRESNQQITPR